MNTEKSPIAMILNSASTMFLVCTLMWCGISLMFDAAEYLEIVRLMVSFFLAGLFIAVFQFVWFTDKLVKKMSYIARTVVFGLCIYFALVACVYIGGWFPIESMISWIAFTIGFLIMLIGITLGYHIYYKRTVGSYEAALEAYHKRSN